MPLPLTTTLPSDKHPIEVYKESSKEPDTPELTVNQIINAAEEVEIEIIFSVNPHSPSLSFYVDPVSSECLHLLVSSSSDRARDWMPCVDDMKRRCRWELEISCPQSTTAVASAAVVQEAPLPDGKKRFTFRQDIAVPACKMGLVVGQLRAVRVAGIATNAVLYGPMGTKQGRFGPTLEFLVRAFGYLNWLLNTRYPWAGLSVVFLREPARPSLSLPSLIVLPTGLLHDQAIIDQTWETRRVLCQTIVEQYYFCRSSPRLPDRWLIPALSRYLALHQLRVFHGNNDYRLQLQLDKERFLQLDGGMGVLFDEQRKAAELEVAGDQLEWLSLRGRLVLVMIEQALGKQSIQRLLIQLFIDANSEDRPEDLFSSAYLLRWIKRITGKDLRLFFDQWITSPGHPIFDVTFAYNRKKSCVDLDIKQSFSHSNTTETNALQAARRPARFTGQLLIRVRETDSAFDHVVHIEDCQHHFDLPFHTKVRKPRQPRKPADPSVSHEQVDEKQQEEEAERAAARVSPVSWVRIDPEMEWMAHARLSQPDIMWTEQLDTEKDVVAQWEAVQALSRLPSDTAAAALERTIADFKTFYKVRAAALVALAGCRIQSIGVKKLLEMHGRRFGLKDHGNGEIIPRPNNFENLPNYYLLLAMAEALSKGGEAGDCQEARQVLLGMLVHNDNATNTYSDGHYIAHVILSLTHSIVTASKKGRLDDSFIKESVKEICRFMSLDRILPTHRNEVTVAAVSALTDLQAASLYNIDSSELLRIAQYGNYIEVRLAAVRSLIRLYSIDALKLLVTGINSDPSRAFCYSLGGVLIESCDNLKGSASAMKDELWTAFWQSKMPITRQQFAILAQRLFSDEPARVITDAAPLVLTLPSPKKVAPVPLEQTQQEQSDWINEVTEGGVPVPATTKVTGFVHITEGGKSTAPPKLRLSIHTADISLKDRIRPVLDALWDSPDSHPFRYPVDPSVPHYYDIIRSPMDLSTLKSNLDSFTDIQSLVRQLRLIFDNCFTFNHPQSVIYAQAKGLRKAALKELKRAFPDHKVIVKEALMADVPITADLNVMTLNDPTTTLSQPDRFHGESDCRQLLSRLRQHPAAIWFLEPVDPVALNIPTYFSAIKEPMDFGTMAGKLSASLYRAKNDFIRDLKLVFHNCFKFNNPTDPVCDDARTLEAIARGSNPDYDNVSISPVSQPSSPAEKSMPKLKLKLGMVSFPEDSCRQIIDALLSDDSSGPFRHPVSGVPGYNKVIRRPMDLGTIRDKLDRREYAALGVLKSDLDVIWSNCAKFNGSDAGITKIARHLADLADNLFHEFGLQ